MSNSGCKYVGATVPSNKILNRLANDFVKFLEAQFILSVAVTWQRSTFTPKK
jgi:hypothetical protein